MQTWGYGAAMRLLSCLAALCALAVSGVAPSLAAAVNSTMPVSPDHRLTEDHRQALQCAGVFAIVASEQAAGVPTALDWPPLAYRGKEYFVGTSTRVMQEAGLSREAVRDLLAQQVTALQQSTETRDADEVVAEAMTPCLPRLDATVPPLEVPSLLQCTAILKVAYDEVHAREGLSPAARDLATLASVLAAREKEALQGMGKTADEADRALVEARETLLAEASNPHGAGAEKYDIARCYELAKPEAKSHY